MPATVRGKPSETGAKKDGAADHKVDPKRPLSGSKDQTRSTDSPKPSTARQRARDRRRERAEAASPERTSPSPDAAAAAADAGRIKNLAGFWSTQKEEGPSVRKKRLEISERKEDAESSESSESDSDDSDEREEIKRAQEAAPTDRNDLVEIQKGSAKSIANIFQNRKEDDESKKKKTPFKLDIKSEEPTVFENEPVVLEGVARADDCVVRDEIVVGRPGRIKDLAVNFTTICSKPRSDDSSDSDDDNTTQKNSTKKKKTQKEEEGEVIERGKIQNVRQRWQKRQQKSASSGRGGGEGTKDSDADVSDSSDDEPSGAPTPPPAKTKGEKVIEQKKVKNIRDRWTRRQDGSEEKDEEKEKEKEKAEAAKGKTPAKAPLRPLDTAKEYGVFENEPVVRDDVVRADDDQPDVISCVRTKKLRRMWTNMEKEVTKDAKNPTETNVRVATTTTTTTKKKKEAKQEPEPEAPKKSSKSQKAISGRYQEAAAATAATAAAADQGKGKERGGEGKGKLQKTFPVAATGVASPEDSAVKPSAPKSPSLARYSSRKKNA